MKEAALVSLYFAVIVVFITVTTVAMNFVYEMDLEEERSKWVLLMLSLMGACLLCYRGYILFANLIDKHIK